MTAQPVHLPRPATTVPAPQLRLVPAPQLAPPPDVPGHPARHPTAQHHVLLRSGAGRPRPGSGAPGPPAGRSGPAGAAAPGTPGTRSGQRPVRTTELPDPARWAHRFVQAAVEVAVALRPAVQLVRWTDEDVYATLARRSDIASRARRSGRLTTPPGRTRVRSVRACPVRDGIVEASAVVADGTRCRCVALRLEGLDGRWQVTALELG